MVGQKALEVVLSQGIDHAEHRGDGADDDDEHAPTNFAARSTEQIEAHLANAEDADLDHAAGHERAHVGGRRRMGLRQPRMEGHHARLRPETEEGQREGQRGDAGGKCMGTERLELKRAGGRGHGEERARDHQKADMGHDEVQKTALERRFRPVDDDEHVGRERHQLEEHEEPKSVVGQDDEIHGGDEQVHEEPDDANARLVVLIEVGKSVEPRHEGQRGDDRDEKACQRIQQEREVREGHRPDPAGVGGCLEQRADAAGKA